MMNHDRILMTVDFNEIQQAFKRLLIMGILSMPTIRHKELFNVLQLKKIHMTTYIKIIKIVIIGLQFYCFHILFAYQY
jgi:hypothetical protein